MMSCEPSRLIASYTDIDLIGLISHRMAHAKD